MVLTPGILSLLSVGSNSANLLTTQATGGTGPYTLQWHRSNESSEFTPDSSNKINGETSLLLSEKTLIPNTKYYYKVVYTDVGINDTVTSNSITAVTFSNSLNPNQFNMTAYIGQLDLIVGGDVVSCQIDSSQILPLFSGQRIKVVTNSGGGLPKIVNNEDIFIPFGYIVYDSKSESYNTGDRCEVARTGSCMWLYATSSIDRGAQVCIDEFISYGVKSSTGDTNLPLVGIAYDQAVSEGQLIRVILETSNYSFDLISNELILDTDENSNSGNTFLRSVINGLASNSIDIQLPVPSPIENNLMSMDDTGHGTNSGVSITISSLSNDDEHVATTAAMQSAILSGVTAGYTFQGEWDASGGTYPTLDHLGAPITMGDNWRITVPGTLPGGKVVFEGDNLLALINIPGQTGSNWSTSIGTGVRKFNGRDGLVDPEDDDYSLVQITGAVAALALKSDLTYVDTQLALKASLTYVNTQLALKSDLTYVDAQLALKASLVQLALKADLIYVDAQLALKASLTQLALKADLTYVDAQLALKSSLIYVDAQLALKASLVQLALKADLTYVDAQLALKAALAGAAFSGAVTVLTPVNPTEAANKSYVDSAITGVGVLANNKIFVGNISNVATAVPVSGDISLANTGLVALINVPSGVATGFIAGVIHSNGTILTSSLIVDADVAAAAAIAVTKLAALTAKGVVTTDTSGKITATALTNGQILIGSTGNAPAAAALTGDISMSSLGLTALINVPSGVATGFSAGVMHSNGTILTSSLIVDADVAAAAAIAVTKLAALTAKGVVTTDTSGKITAAALTNGQILIGSTGNAPVAATITGTTNRVTVTNSAGGITLSGPQDIATASTPTFASVTLSNAPSAVSDATRKDYVDAAILAAAPAYSNVSASGSINLTSQYLLTTQSVDGSTIRLPDGNTTLYNAIYTIFLIGAAANATITVPTGQYLNNVLNGTVSITATPGAVASFRSNAAGYWVQIDNTAALALKANLASPPLTGTPTAPTAPLGTNTTQIATTQFVTRAVPTYSNVSASGNINLTSEYLLTTQSTDGTTIRLPDGNTTQYNAIYTIKLIGSAANATITVPTGQYLNDVLNGTVSIVATPGAVASFRSNAAGYWVQIDNTAALALKANLSGGATFTGNIIIPDQLSGDNSSKASNTKYIDSSLLTLNNINGLKLSWASSTTLGLTSGYWNVIGSSIMRTNAAVTINIANVGVVNGLDAGSAANSTNYYVYAIGHGTTPALNGAILSTNSTTPTLPSGYTVYRYIGRVRRNGSGAFISFIQTGSGTLRTTNYTDTTTSTQVIAGGGASTFTALSLATFVPPGVRKGIIRFDKATTAANSYFATRETGSSVAVATSLRSICTGGITDSLRLPLEFICNTSQSIDYTMAGGGDLCNVYVQGYEEEL